MSREFIMVEVMLDEEFSGLFLRPHNKELLDESGVAYIPFGKVLPWMDECIYNAKAAHYLKYDGYIRAITVPKHWFFPYTSFTPKQQFSTSTKPRLKGGRFTQSVADKYNSKSSVNRKPNKKKGRFLG